MGLEPTTTKSVLDALNNWPFCSVLTFYFGYCLRQSPNFLKANTRETNYMGIAQWTDKYSIHLWTSFWSKSRKLTWEGFDPTTIEFRSDAQRDWIFRTWVQLALRGYIVQASFRLLVSSSVATFFLMKIYIYIYIYREREREDNHFYTCITLTQVRSPAFTTGGSICANKTSFETSFSCWCSQFVNLLVESLLPKAK